MALELYDNAVSEGTSTTLSAPISDTDIAIPVVNIASPKLQSTAGQFRIIVINPQNGESELMLVTGNAWTPNWSVTRAIEGTFPVPFPMGSVVKHVLTAGAIANLVAQAVKPSIQESGNYTFQLGDAGSVIESTSSADVTFSLADNNVLDYPLGTEFEVFQRGTGRVTIAGGPDVVLLSPGNLVRTAGQYATIRLRQSEIDQWVISGDVG